MKAAIDPTFRQPKTPAPVQRMAAPVALLGVPPGKDVAYFSELARGLTSPDAAFVDAPISQYQPRGATFTATA